MPRYVCLLSIVAIAQFGLGIAGLTAADPSPAAPITFNKDIASIVFQKCAVCHHPGEVAPFPLLSYSDVKKRARQIETVTRDRFMPPWKSVEGHGRFVGERRLTKEQIDLIVRWVEQGAVEGDSRDLPPPPTFREGWMLGQPDIVLTMPEPYSVPPDGADVFRNFVFALTIPEGKYIKALEYRPGNRLVVHHAALMMDTKGKAREKDEADPGPGFGGSALPGQLLSGSLAAWTPGRDPIPLPDGLSLPWKPGTDLILQLHLHPSGKPETEQSTIGLYLTDRPPQRSMVDMGLINTKIDIPPGDSSYRTRDEFTLPVKMEALGLFPHMHLIGREFKVTARPPDGQEPFSLIWINDWDFNWQGFYQYETPVMLPAGTQIIMETVHDNSAENFRNPNTPPKRMKWGEQTTDEMSVAILHLVPAREEDRGKLVAKLRGRILGEITAAAPAEQDKGAKNKAARPPQNGTYAVLRDGLTPEEARVEGAEHVVLLYDKKYTDADQNEPNKYVAIDTTSFVPLAIEGAPEMKKDGKGMSLLSVTLARENVEQVEDFTRAHLGGRVAIIFDGEIVTLHKVRTIIEGGKLQITRCTDNACEILRTKLAK